MTPYNNIKGWNEIKNLLKSINGQSYVSLLKQLEKEDLHIVNYSNQIIFIKRCVQNGLIPKGMRIKLTKKEQRCNEILKSTNILQKKRIHSCKSTLYHLRIVRLIDNRLLSRKDCL